ncbi:flagellar export chaperone FlgN [bacterium]|nr:flagellar export chaperone FlgN [bacterium]
METQLAALEAALRHEVAAYQGLLNRLPFKLALIRKNRVDQLEHLTRQEEADLARLLGFERERNQSVQAILSALPAGTEPSLSGILPHLTPDWHSRLAPLGDRLREQVGALREGHETCKILLKASLEYVDITMQLVSRTVANAQPLMYGGADEETPLHSPSLLLDRRA